MEGQRPGRTGSQVSKAGGRYLQKSDVAQVALLPVVEENKVKGLDPEHVGHLGNQVTRLTFQHAHLQRMTSGTNIHPLESTGPQKLTHALNLNVNVLHSDE